MEDAREGQDRLVFRNCAAVVFQNLFCHSFGVRLHGQRPGPGPRARNDHSQWPRLASLLCLDSAARLVAMDPAVGLALAARPLEETRATPERRMGPAQHLDSLHGGSVHHFPRQAARVCIASCPGHIGDVRGSLVYHERAWIGRPAAPVGLVVADDEPAIVRAGPALRRPGCFTNSPSDLDAGADFCCDRAACGMRPLLKAPGAGWLRHDGRRVDAVDVLLE